MSARKPMAVQIGRRLLASLALAALFATLAGVWFYQEAGRRAAADRLSQAVSHYRNAIAVLDRNWGRSAYQYKARLEYTRILMNPDSRRDRLLSYVTIQGNSQEFGLVQVQDRRGSEISVNAFSHELAPVPEFPEGSPYGWAWDADKERLFRVFRQTIWLGEEGNGELRLYLPLDNAFLTQTVYPDTHIALLWQNRVVASSAGNDGIRRAEAAVQARVANGQVAVLTWETASENSPKLFVQAAGPHPFKVVDLAVPLAGGGLVFALAAWAILGRWSVQVLRRLLALRQAQERFAQDHRLDEATLAALDEARRTNDEIRSVATSLGDLMGSIAAHEDAEEAAQDALRQSERRFRFLVEGTRAIAWECDTGSDAYAYISPRAEETFGYPLAAWAKPGILDSVLHPDDRERVLAERRGVQESKIDATLYYRARTQYGDVLWIEDIVSPILGESGQVSGLRGIMLDITERKEMEERLALAGLVFERADEGIMVTDAENRLITVNPAFERITGYRAAEVIGKNPRFLQSGRQEPSFYAEMWRTLERQGQWRGDLWNRRKDGDFYVQHTSIQTIRDAQGRPHRRVALLRDVTQLRRQAEEIEHQATHDTLTGLPNRRLLRDRIDSALARAHREGRQVAVLMLDLDGFKRVNDTLGHPVGDLLLIQAAERLKECIRGADTLARLGGDEFMVVLESLPKEQDAQTVAIKILERLEEVFRIEAAEIYVTGSLGIAVYPGDGTDADTLLANADTAMYQAKAGGKNAYRFFTQSMHEQVSARLRLENELRHGLAAGDFVLHYQPVVELGSRRIVKAEALLRWDQPERGLVAPGNFIAAAEESGLIVPLGEWVIREAARQMRAWQDAAGAGFRVCVNLSAQQFHRGNPVQLVREALRASGARPEQLTVEITERLFLDDSLGTASAYLAEMMRDGIRVAIDDFGTGYSSLSYLMEVPVQELKIDASFIRGIPGEARSLALIDAILSLSRSFGMEVIAEGVETEEQAAYLAERGCRYGQGYLFGRPMSAGEMTERLERD